MTMQQRLDDAQDAISFIPSAPGRGLVMPIGGAEDKEGHADILKEFVRLAGGERSHIVVIPTASSTPDESGGKYADLFRQFGANEAEIFMAENSHAADRDDSIAMLERASGIFMTGGDQSRLADVFDDTRAAETIRRCNAQGVIVAGTSAGAAFMASDMIVGGESRATPIKGSTRLRAGLGMLQNIVVDTHFGERGRTGRLLEVVASHPHLITIGCDEDTAAIIDADLIMRVAGSGSVLVLDGTAIRSDFLARADDEPIMTNGAELHVITSRYTFDIRGRKFVPPLQAAWTQGEDTGR